MREETHGCFHSWWISKEEKSTTEEIIKRNQHNVWQLHVSYQEGLEPLEAPDMAYLHPAADSFPGTFTRCTEAQCQMMESEQLWEALLKYKAEDC